VTWAKLDDRFHQNPKVLAVSHGAFRLYVCTITYCRAHDTGAIPVIACQGLARMHRVPYAAATRDLLAAGLFEVYGHDGWAIHDYHDYDPPEYVGNRAANSLGGKKSAEARRQKYGSAQPPPPRSGLRSDFGRSVSKSLEVVPVPDPTLLVKSPNGALPVIPPDDRQVFETWKAAAGKNGRTEFDAKRRKAVRAALKAYPLDDVLDAVQGWRYSPHHCGQNESKTVYNGLELLLRDSEQIEKFRDLQRNGPSLGPTITPESLRLAQWANEEPVEVMP